LLHHATAVVIFLLPPSLHLQLYFRSPSPLYSLRERKSESFSEICLKKYYICSGMFILKIYIKNFILIHISCVLKLFCIKKLFWKTHSRKHLIFWKICYENLVLLNSFLKNYFINPILKIVLFSYRNYILKSLFLKIFRTGTVEVTL